MKRKNVLVLAALLTALVMMLAGCGGDADETGPQESTPAAVSEQSLGLTDWELTATTWSSPNGATVNLSATPNGYSDGDSAAFVVRLEGEEIANVPCEWDGSQYTAYAELNAADGYCYYVVLTGADGTRTEVAVNTPTEPTDEALINMEASLNSYCNLVVSDCTFDGTWLAITDGQVEVQPPRITNAGQTITCAEAVLVLSLNGEEIGRTELELPEAASDGSVNMQLTGSSFQVPEMEDDQQLSLRLDVTLSNGQSLSAPGGTWFYNAGELLIAVG